MPPVCPFLYIGPLSSLCQLLLYNTIIADYNAGEEVGAKKQHREAVLLPDFSAHHLRHTFCTRLCEKETNLKVIQSVMGHKDIQTTMDIYAEATEEKKQESFERLAATLDIF